MMFLMVLASFASTSIEIPSLRTPSLQAPSACGDPSAHPSCKQDLPEGCVLPDYDDMCATMEQDYLKKHLAKRSPQEFTHELLKQLRAENPGHFSEFTIVGPKCTVYHAAGETPNTSACEWGWDGGLDNPFVSVVTDHVGLPQFTRVDLGHHLKLPEEFSHPHNEEAAGFYFAGKCKGVAHFENY